MSKKKEKEKTNPTPHFGIRKSNRQIFTVAENKLLDQMTIEIIEAWKSDLKKMRKCYEMSIDAADNLTQHYKLVEDIKNLMVDLKELAKKKKWWQFWK